jgi:GNAT superfamily N-acetyltransferase
MQSIDFLVETKLTRTPRVQQLEGMFDVPPAEKLSRTWRGEVPIDDREWNVGLIVGPSGAGKSTVARQMFGEPRALTWRAASIVDDFDERHSMQDIAEICSAVGFNTIPSWMKPHSVLSTGEQFRAALARHLIEDADPIVIDEFTSVIDRQVAHIGSHAVQKYVRKHNRKFVAVTCHYDVIDWLQPDWMLEPATMNFQWRELQRRPALAIEIARVDHSAWKLFAPFHYLTAELHKAAACFCLFVDDVPASFGGMLHRPHAHAADIKGLSRLVTLPDYQGMGLALVLSDALGGAYKALGFRMHTYPAHPSLIRAYDRSPRWSLRKRPGTFSPRTGDTGLVGKGAMGGRPCAVFEYVGEAVASNANAKALIEGYGKGERASRQREVVGTASMPDRRACPPLGVSAVRADASAETTKPSVRSVAD